LNPLINHYLNAGRVRRRAIFDVDHVNELVTRTKAGTVDAAYTIWSLLAVESWLTQFVPNDQFPAFRTGSALPKQASMV
jgi:asparagine synthase (glutamine-hydrolysing)